MGVGGSHCVSSSCNSDQPVGFSGMNMRDENLRPLECCDVLTVNNLLHFGGSLHL